MKASCVRWPRRWSGGVDWHLGWLGLRVLLCCFGRGGSGFRVSDVTASRYSGFVAEGLGCRQRGAGPVKDVELKFIGFKLGALGFRI